MSARRVGFAVRIGISIAVLLGSAWLLLNFQFAIDQFRVWRFEPSSHVAALSQRAALSPTGQFYFYASSPRLSDRQEFNTQCQKRDSGSVVLGCYTGQFIYVFDVKDPRLDGIQEVTAAHEMLHAAYDRIGDGERSRLRQLLIDQVEALQDKALMERLDIYKNASDDERINEYHSILATEVKTLSPQLEAHYKKYFKDRAVVIALYQQYASVFSELKSQQDLLIAELERSSASTNSAIASYNQQAAELSSDVEDFNDRADSGAFSDQASFNAERQRLLSRQSILQSDLTTINQQLAAIETLRARLAELNVQAGSLNASIDSQPSSLPSL